MKNMYFFFVFVTLAPTSLSKAKQRERTKKTFSNEHSSSSSSSLSSTQTLQIKGDETNLYFGKSGYFYFIYTNSLIRLTTRYGSECANVNNNFIFNVFKTALLLRFLYINSINSHLNKCHKNCVHACNIMGATHLDSYWHCQFDNSDITQISWFIYM